MRIDAVELVGDVTRTPTIHDIIKTVFDVSELKRTLNSQEYIARGVAALTDPDINYEVKEDK